MSVTKLISLLNLAEKELGNHSVREVKVLAYLFQSKHNLVCYQSIIKNLNISAVSVTRSLKHLSDLDMVTLLINTDDTRSKSVALTDKGNEFKLKVIEIIEGKI